MNSTAPKSKALELLPYGLIATREWLLKNGVSSHTIDNWVKSEKLKVLTRGVYARTGVPITWQAVVVSLNRMSNQPTYVGGLSALEEYGVAHYLQARQIVQLYSENHKPAWLNKLDLDEEYEWNNSTKLFETEYLYNANSFRHIAWQKQQPDYLLAKPELAYMQVLANVPNKIGFEHADQLMQSLSTLSPKRINILLTYCKSIKVKRLFLWFAYRQNFAWCGQLNLESYDLGSGKRLIEKKGKLDQRFLITVPARFHG